MHAVAGKAQQHVALGDARGQFGPALHRAHGKTGEIEVAGLVHARHLGGLAADQGAARGLAAGGDAFDDARRRLGLELAGGEIVEEKQRLGTLADKIVDAHGHEVDADAADLSGVDGDAQLGAHPVGRRDQHRVFEPRRFQVEQRAEAAEPGHDAGAVGAPRGGFDPLDEFIAGVDVDACVGIGQPVLLVGHMRPRGPFWVSLVSTPA